MIVGVLGGGQLARMLALAGHPLGFRFIFLDPAPDACAAALGRQLRGGYEDAHCLEQLATQADVITYEFENVPHEGLAALSARGTLFPPVDALAIARDRLREKNLFRELGIPTPAFAAVDDLQGLEQAVAQIGLPCVIKTRTLGYDGQGQAVLHRHEDLPEAWRRLAQAPCIVEAFVSFRREVSIIAVRGRGGETLFYPLSENTHREGILRLSLCRSGDPLQAQAEACARRLLDALDYVGVLALELFEGDDGLLANEFAPRVHNSGHWTIEGAETSQFENHLRAITGLPLGATHASAHVAMLNLIGTVPSVGEVLAVKGAHLHLYDKAPRPRRKLGHVTLRAADGATLKASLQRLRRVVDPQE